MRFYESSTDIAAAPAAVWDVLVDAGNWPTWESDVRDVEGTVALGAKLKITSEADPKRAFPVRVAELTPSRRLVFRGGMPLGLFKGVRTYTLTPAGDGTAFTMREEYTGLMLPLIWRSMLDLQPSFDQFARGLKAKVEGG